MSRKITAAAVALLSFASSASGQVAGPAPGPVVYQTYVPYVAANYRAAQPAPSPMAASAMPAPAVDWQSYGAPVAVRTTAMPAYGAAMPAYGAYRGPGVEYASEPGMPYGSYDPSAGLYSGVPADGCGCGGYECAAGPGCAPSGCCEACGPCVAPRSRGWYVSGGALFLTREEQDSYTFSYDSANEEVQLVDAANADMDFTPGFEATVGWFDCCCQTGWELTYWQLLPSTQSTQYLGSMLSPGTLDGIRNYDQVDYSGGGAGDGATAADNVNNAAIHRLTRDWEVYNVEANHVRLFSQGCCSPWRFTSLCGFRFFKFQESLLFVSDPNDTMINGDPDEYRIRIRTDNNLYGFQLGGITERGLGGRWAVRLLTKGGLYNNHSELDYFEGGSAGAATINNGPNVGQPLRVRTSTDDLAFLGELGLGLSYRIGYAWRIGADYRVIGVTGIAQPTDQIYFDTRGIQDVRRINNDASLLLHGAFVRVERCF